MQKIDFLKYDHKTRQKRLCLIVLVLYLGYYILSCYLNVAMAIVNYLIYPLAFYFCGNLFYSDNHNQTSDNQCQYKYQYSTIKLLNFVKLVAIILVFIVLIAWLPALFLNSTTDLNLVNFLAAENYLSVLWLLIPWPAIIAYLGLFSVLVQKHRLNDIFSIANQILPGKIKNDTVNNAIVILHSFPFMAMTCLLVAIMSYSSYLAIANALNMEPFVGASLVNLMIAMFLFVLATKKQIKTILRALNYSSWSVAKFLIIVAVVLLIWLLVPTVIVQLLAYYFLFDQTAYLIGSYNYQHDNLALVYQCLVSSLWWFCVPIVAMCCYKQVSLIFYKYSMIVVLLAFSIVFLISQWTVIQQLFIYCFNYTMNLSAINQQILFSGTIFGLLSYIYSGRYDKNSYTYEYIDVLDNKSNKHRAASKSYYYLFLTVLILLLMILLENIFMIQKLIAYTSILNSLLLVVFIRGYYKYITAQLPKTR